MKLKTLRENPVIEIVGIGPCLLALAIFLMAIVGVLDGCATTAKVAYTTLASIGSAENGAMVVAANAEVKGTITMAQWQQIAAKHALFLVAYDTACNAAAVSLDQATVPANVTALKTDLVNLVASFIPTK